MLADESGAFSPRPAPVQVNLSTRCNTVPAFSYLNVGACMHSERMGRESRMPAHVTDVEVVELTQEEDGDLFDQVVRREMGMSGPEFLARWDAGEYEGVDFDTVPGLVTVYMYLPFAR